MSSSKLVVAHQRMPIHALEQTPRGLPTAETRIFSVQALMVLRRCVIFTACLLLSAPTVSAEDYSGADDSEDTFLASADILEVRITPQDGVVLVDIVLRGKIDPAAGVGYAIYFELHGTESDRQYNLAAEVDQGQYAFSGGGKVVTGAVRDNVVHFEVPSDSSHTIRSSDIVEMQERIGDPLMARTFDRYDGQSGWCTYDRFPDRSYGSRDEMCVDPSESADESGASDDEPDSSDAYDGSDRMDYYSCLIDSDNCGSAPQDDAQTEAGTPWMPISFAFGLGVALLVCVLLFLRGGRA